ncbi:MAG: A/G-specific adenine glycosylase [Methanolinea sp.]|jgi:A/G-specific adenine glycosylase|nr:A/G-specific adenine glycosylase [Methanolinea sp.]
MVLPEETEAGGVLSLHEIQEFRERVYRFYRVHRRDLPWRNTHDPYAILVSEMMLQQTQVERVCGRYERFLARFPDFVSLAGADLSDVLKEWQGLGYNRRAKALYQIAGRVVDDYGGQLPMDEGTLTSLPGIGKATAASLVAFAYNRPSLVIETNIRRVFIHCFFPGQTEVRDREIQPLVAATCDRENPRDWYYALMDFGSTLKKQIPNPNRRSAHYRKQPPFEGSDRMVRGRILALLVRENRVGESEIPARLDLDQERIARILGTLEKEGFLKRERGVARLL